MLPMIQHFTSVRVGCGRFNLAPDHPRYFFHPLIVDHPLDGADCRTGVLQFGYHQMVVCRCRDWRQVGHGEHLPVLAQVSHQAADSLRHRTTNACVDFIKNKGLRLA